MELMETLANRRSVRKYKDVPVPRDVLEHVLEAACMAPSAENMQPWYFVALTQPEDILLLQNTMEQVAESMRPHLEELYPRHPRIVGNVTGFLRRLGGAPVYVLVFLQQDYGHVRDSMLESTAAAIQNLLLAAHEQGVGTCWVNAATAFGYGPALQELFAPDKGEFVSLVALGYPDQMPRTPGRKPGRWVIR